MRSYSRSSNSWPPEHRLDVQRSMTKKPQADLVSQGGAAVDDGSALGVFHDVSAIAYGFTHPIVMANRKRGAAALSPHALVGSLSVRLSGRFALPALAATAAITTSAIAVVAVFCQSALQRETD